MPQLVTYRQRRHDGRWLRVHVPVVPILALLMPLLVLAGLVACVVFRVNPLGAVSGTGRLLWAVSGTRLHIDDGETAYEIDLR